MLQAQRPADKIRFFQPSYLQVMPMNWFLLCTLAIFFLIAPVSVSADVRWQGQADLALLIRVWGAPFRMRRRVLRTPKGHRFFTLHDAQPPEATPAPSVRKGLALLGAFLRGDHARRFLRRHVHLRSLDALAILSLEDAAATAILSGLVQGLLSLMPCAWQRKAHIRVRPGFPARQSLLQARCIVSFRLGSLLFAALLAFIAYAAEAREHRVPLVSKEG